MPFSNYDRVDLWSSYQERGIDLVVVLTEPQEYLVYSGRDLLEFYRENDLKVLHMPIPDFGVPMDLESWESSLDLVVEEAHRGKNVAVHCLAGLGRTGTFLACLAKETFELEGDEAINWIREYLPGAMENQSQEEFVIRFQR
jgi:protein-tyrosine phosphatase